MMADAVELPPLSAAVCDCYFDPLQKRILPTEHLRAWALSLSQHILYIESATFKDAIIPAWRRLDKRLSSDELERLRDSSASAILQVRGEPLRSGRPLPDHVLESTEMQPFVRLANALPPHNAITWMVFSVEMDNGTNFCMLADLATRKLEIVSCVCEKIEYSLLNDITQAALWFSAFALHKIFQQMVVFRSKIEHIYCTLFSMYYLQMRIGQSIPLTKLGALLTMEHLQQFLSHFVSRASLTQRARQAQRAAQTAQQRTLTKALYVLEQCRLAADLGKCELLLAASLLEPASVAAFLEERVRLTLTTMPDNPTLTKLSWS
jgi:hypothetical protein